MNSVDESIRRRQSRVTLSGGKWEEYVRIYLSEELQGSGIDVIRGKYESEIKNRSLTLWRMLSLPLKWRMLSLPLKTSILQETVWGDLDLIAVKGEIPITVISCKTSLHGRLTETLFWSLLFKTLTKIKIVLATSDAGSGKPEELKSEWGTLENPNKNRLLSESYLDGVYVENVPEFCNLSAPTSLGGIVRPLSELPEDIRRWTEDAKRFFTLH